MIKLGDKFHKKMTCFLVTACISISPCNSLFADLAVVVDAYGPGRYYVEYFAKKGVKTIHLQSSKKPLNGFTLANVDKYEALVIHDEDIAATAAQLILAAENLGEKIICVIAGAEPGVLLADELSEKLNLQTNGTKRSLARRDKFAMAEAAQAHGIQTPQMYKTALLEEALVFARSLGVWPVVLKPLNSAGTNGVHICYSEDEMRQAFLDVLGTTNNLGLVNEEILVQSYLAGREYMVNSVSLNGQHYITDIWIYDKSVKPGYATIYDRNVLLESESPVSQILAEFTKNVLDSLEIKFGPGHTEVIITEAGPALVECAARASGGCEPTLMFTCLHHNQMDLTVDAYIEPAVFLERTKKPYIVFKKGIQVFFVSKREGKIKALNLEDNLRKLPSFLNAIIRIKVGSDLKKTIDLATTAGFCHLVGDDFNVLDQDYRQIEKIFNDSIVLE